MTIHAKFDTYEAACHDPKSGQDVTFKIQAISPAHADTQARDGYFGLLPPASDARRAELEVIIARC